MNGPVPTPATPATPDQVRLEQIAHDLSRAERLKLAAWLDIKAKFSREEHFTMAAKTTRTTANIAALHLLLANLQAEWAEQLRSAKKKMASKSTPSAEPTAPAQTGACRPDGEGHFPRLVDPELHGEESRWNAAKRRQVADKMERWVQQLRFSADAMDRFGDALGEEPELIVPDAELADTLQGCTRAEAVAKAGKFQEWAGTILAMIGLKQKPAPVVASFSN